MSRIVLTGRMKQDVKNEIEGIARNAWRINPCDLSLEDMQQILEEMKAFPDLIAYRWYQERTEQEWKAFVAYWKSWQAREIKKRNAVA